MLLVLSGFSVHRSHLRHPEEPLPRYFARRVIGLYPPYLVAILLFALVLPWTRVDLFRAEAGRQSEGLMQVVTHLFLVHNWSERTFTGLNPSLWTLAVEVQLYALYPALLWIRRAAGWKRTLWILGSLEVTVRLTSELFRGDPTLHRILIGSPFAYWFCWGLGAYLADHMAATRRSVPARTGDETAARTGNETAARTGGETAAYPGQRRSSGGGDGTPRAYRVPTAIIGLVYAAALGFYYFRPLDVLIYPLTATAAFWICARVVQPEAADPRSGSQEKAQMLDRRGSRGIRAFAALGVMSYSVYLLHQPLIRPIPWALEKAGITLAPEVVFLICLASFGLVLIPARLMYLWVELPARRLSRARFLTRFTEATRLAPASERHGRET